MPRKRVHTEPFPMSDFLKEEMKAREWQAKDICERCSLPLCRVEAILGGEYMELKEATHLAYAFGCSALLLLSLQYAYLDWVRKKE